MKTDKETKSQNGKNEKNKALEARLQKAGLRITAPRLALARLLFGSDEKAKRRHVTPEFLFAEARTAGVRLSQATVYNTLNQFCAAGLLRQVVAAGKNNDGKAGRVRTYFDTNLTPHQHFYIEEEGRLIDVEASELALEKQPNAPSGYRLDGVDVVVHLKPQ